MFRACRAVPSTVESCSSPAHRRGSVRRSRGMRSSSLMPGTNQAVKEFAERYHVPVEAASGGAETAYPEYRLKMKAPPAPAGQANGKDN